MNAARTSCLKILCLASCLVVALQGEGGGMIVVPMTDQDLAESSAVILLGTVDSLSAKVDSAGGLSTRVTIGVEEQIKGQPQPAVTVVVPGGTVGEVSRVVVGAPPFSQGERVLVFLRYRPNDGAFMLNGLAMGKYTVMHSPAGDVGRRELGGPAVDDVRPLSEFLKTLRGIVAGEPTGPHGDAMVRLPESSSSRGEAFVFMNPPARWTEPDQGRPVVYQVDPTGDALCGPEASQAGAALALAAWTNAGASLRLLDGGPAAPAPFSTCDGVSTIQFNDPFDEIGAMVHCTGVLAIGGYCSTSIGESIVDGVRFARITEGDVTINKGLAGCAYWDPTSLAEVLTHELGHTVGLAHSAEDALEPDPLLRDATMYFLAHFDGRGAGLRADDIAGVRALYPLPATLSPTPTVADTPTPSSSVTPIPSDGGGASGCAITRHQEARPGAWGTLGLLVLVLRPSQRRHPNVRAHSLHASKARPTRVEFQTG